jgi:hypothetical protein
MERQVTLKSIIIPSSSDLIAPLVICSLISHEVFADSPSFSFKWYLIPKQLVFYEYAKKIYFTKMLKIFQDAEYLLIMAFLQK